MPADRQGQEPLNHGTDTWQRSVSQAARQEEAKQGKKVQPKAMDLIDAEQVECEQRPRISKDNENRQYSATRGYLPWGKNPKDTLQAGKQEKDLIVAPSKGRAER